MEDLVYEVGGDGGELDAVTPVVDVAEGVGGEAGLHNWEVGAEQDAVGDLVLDGDLEAVVELPLAVEPGGEVCEDVEVLAQEHDGLLHLGLAEVGDDYLEVSGGSGNFVQGEDVSPFKGALGVVHAAHVEHDGDTEVLGHVVEAPGLGGPGSKPW